MGRHYARITVPSWGLDIPDVGPLLREVEALVRNEGAAGEIHQQGEIMDLAGRFGQDGDFPPGLESALQANEVPYDFFITDGAGLGMDAKGYWRPGMEVPRTWLDKAAVPVPELSSYPDPRLARAKRLRSFMHKRSTMGRRAKRTLS